MATLRDKLLEIVLPFAEGATADDVLAAQSFQDVGMDSVAMLTILTELESEFDIEVPDDSESLTTFADLEQLISRLVAEKNA